MTYWILSRKKRNTPMILIRNMDEGKQAVQHNSYLLYSTNFLKPFAQICTHDGNWVRTYYPFWLALDAQGKPYPIHPNIKTQDYEEIGILANNSKLDNFESCVPQ